MQFGILPWFIRALSEIFASFDKIYRGITGRELPMAQTDTLTPLTATQLGARDEQFA